MLAFKEYRSSTLIFSAVTLSAASAAVVIHDAYESGIDSLQEYKENKERLNDDRSKLEFELHNLLHKKKEKFTDKSEVLKEIKSVNDVLKDPDVGYEEKGMLIRTIVDQIVWDKENNKMYFDIIVH